MATRADRTAYLWLLALMNTDASTQGWSYPYWNIMMIDAALAALADATRDGTVNPAPPAVAPTLTLLASGGSLATGQTLEVVQTFVDEYGRETSAGAAETISTGAPVADPGTAPTLNNLTQEAAGFEGGQLLVVYSWTDGSGGETLASPAAELDLPYLEGLYSQLDVVLPSTPAAAGAAGANIYVQHRGGNVVLAKQLTDDSLATVHLDEVIANCWRTDPLVNSMGSAKAIEIEGIAGGAGIYSRAETTRFYVRQQGATWTDADRRICISGADEWDVSTVSYPLTYTGASEELVPGFPPDTTQVKAIRPVDLATEVSGTLDDSHLPDEAVLEVELAKTTGDGVISGLAVGVTAPASMDVVVAAGEAMLPIGRVLPAEATLAIPIADALLHRIDIICLMDDGVIEGPTENAALKGVADATPAAPATPAGALALAEVYVEAASADVQVADITDTRTIIPTVVDLADELRTEDFNIAGDLTTHEADADAHSSHRFTKATVNQACGASATTDFTFAGMGEWLVVELELTATTAGTLDYDFYLYSNAGRTALEYQAGNGDDAGGAGIATASFTDRIPWEWFGGETVYARVKNRSGDAISDLAIDIQYRK